MPNTALITGASSGIGRELARYHAAKGGDLILTARREAALRDLKAELEGRHGITARVFALDLGAEDGARKLINAVTAAGLRVDILINNAGFGGQGLHVERDVETELAMVDLNIRALVALTHEFARRMAVRGGGRILNVGSTAGMVPGPCQAVYYATKAFVNSFSQAIDEELRGKGVTCTVLAPGYVETEFAGIAGLEGTLLVMAGGNTAEKVAQVGYDAMMKGRLVAVDRWSLSLLLQRIVPLTPRRLVLKAVAKAQRK